VRSASPLPLPWQCKKSARKDRGGGKMSCADAQVVSYGKFGRKNGEKGTQKSVSHLFNGREVAVASDEDDTSSALSPFIHHGTGTRISRERTGVDKPSCSKNERTSNTSFFLSVCWTREDLTGSGQNLALRSSAFEILPYYEKKKKNRGYEGTKRRGRKFRGILTRLR